jgi:Cu-Zn family superoxide dismutase
MLGDVTMRTILIAAALGALAQPCLAATGPLLVAIKGPAGQDIGSAMVTDSPRGVLLKLELKDLPPGWHGLHFHEKGDCSSADFKSAGAHVHGPATAVHGLLNPAANEAGDLPNLHVGADGAGHAEVFSAWTSLGPVGDRLNLADIDGSAIVVHASADDHISQPIGGAGARLACGVIRPQ